MAEMKMRTGVQSQFEKPTKVDEDLLSSYDWAAAERELGAEGDVESRVLHEMAKGLDEAEIRAASAEREAVAARAEVRVISKRITRLEGIMTEQQDKLGRTMYRDPKTGRTVSRAKTYESYAESNFGEQIAEGAEKRRRENMILALGDGDFAAGQRVDAIRAIGRSNHQLDDLRGELLEEGLISDGKMAPDAVRRLVADATAKWESIMKTQETAPKLAPILSSEDLEAMMSGEATTSTGDARPDPADTDTELSTTTADVEPDAAGGGGSGSGGESGGDAGGGSGGEGEDGSEDDGEKSSSSGKRQFWRNLLPGSIAARMNTSLFHLGDRMNRKTPKHHDGESDEAYEKRMIKSGRRISLGTLATGLVLTGAIVRAVPAVNSMVGSALDHFGIDIPGWLPGGNADAGSHTEVVSSLDSHQDRVRDGVEVNGGGVHGGAAGGGEIDPSDIETPKWNESGLSPHDYVESLNDAQIHEVFGQDYSGFDDIAGKVGLNAYDREPTEILGMIDAANSDGHMSIDEEISIGTAWNDHMKDSMQGNHVQLAQEYLAVVEGDKDLTGINDLVEKLDADPDFASDIWAQTSAKMDQNLQTAIESGTIDIHFETSSDITTFAFRDENGQMQVGWDKTPNRWTISIGETGERSIDCDGQIRLEQEPTTIPRVPAPEAIIPVVPVEPAPSTPDTPPVTPPTPETPVTPTPPTPEVPVEPPVEPPEEPSYVKPPDTVNPEDQGGGATGPAPEVTEPAAPPEVAPEDSTGTTQQEAPVSPAPETTPTTPNETVSPPGEATPPAAETPGTGETAPPDEFGSL